MNTRGAPERHGVSAISQFENIPQGLNPISFLRLVAWLKPCPFKTNPGKGRTVESSEGNRARCTIALVSTGPQLIRPQAAQERNWLPMIVAAVILVAVAIGLVLFYEHGKSAPAVTPISAALDPYAGNLTISNLRMSESANLAGGKVTYIDGSIANTGSRTVTGITVQVLFRDPAHEVAQNETQALNLIRTREPYIDVEPVSAAPLKPGDSADFRLIFDTIAQDWDGAFPEIRLIHVDAK